jgi:predicted DNA-binding transcriptional regulator AlpA
MTKSTITIPATAPVLAGSILPVDPDQMIGAIAVAKLLNVNKGHIDRLNATGRLPRPIRLGRSVRWRKATIVEFVEASERAGRLLSREEWEAIAYSGTGPTTSEQE